MQQYGLYECVERLCPDSRVITVTEPDGTIKSYEPFRYVPVSFAYDRDGMEQACPAAQSQLRFRFFPDRRGAGRTG